MKHNSNSKQQIIGIIWMILHCFLMSLILTMARFAADHTFNVFQITFLYNLFSCLFIVLWILAQEKNNLKSVFKVNNRHLYILLAILGFVSLTIFFYVISIVSLIEARAIALTSPLVSSLFAVIFLKEKIGLYRTTGLIIGFAGALVVINPLGVDFSYASLLVVAVVFCGAVANQIIRILGRSESITAQIFYTTLLISFFSAIPAFYNWQVLQLWHIGFFAVMGLIFLLDCMAILSALKNAEISVVMPFGFTGIIFVAIIAYLVFGEIINLHTIIGSAIIIVSNIYVIYRQTKKAKEVHNVTFESKGLS